MKTKISLLICAFSFLYASHVQAAENDTINVLPVKKHKYYLDYIMGPYLFISHIPYDAVFMNGCRLGFNIKRHLDFSIEYVVGQQQDDQNTLGMTHNVNGQLAYHFLPKSQPFNPYLFAGGGFFEFKAFTNDIYGISFHAGAGTTVKFTKRISGLFEARYLNLGPMNIQDEGGIHQLAVFWGARLGF